MTTRSRSHHRWNVSPSISSSNNNRSTTSMQGQQQPPLRQPRRWKRPRTNGVRYARAVLFIRVIILLIAVYFIVNVIDILYHHDHSQYSLPSHGSSLLSVSSLFAATRTSNHDYDLAKFESYGFFTDIDSDTWRRHQQQAHYAIKEESIYYNKFDPNDQAIKNPAAWLMLNVHPFFTCPNVRRLGGHGDGAKWTCDPHRFVQQSDCLIYSFGSSGQYTFEDTIVSHSRNSPEHSAVNHNTCEIHVFDPEPSYARSNDTILHNIHYHAWGLQSSRVAHTEKKYKWQFESQYMNIYEIIQQLGHVNRRIDVLKIDCEGCEWTTYHDWLFTTTTNTSTTKSSTSASSLSTPLVHADIRQILIETHSVFQMIDGGPQAFFNAMIQNHYVLFSKEANTHPGARPYGLFYEWSWLKLHPNFFV